MKGDPIPDPPGYPALGPGEARHFAEVPTAPAHHGLLPPRPGIKREEPYHGVMKPPLAKADMVVMPGHYARFKIEPIHFIAANRLDWFQGNIVKYVSRHDAKNGQEDILKAIRYGVMYLRFLAEDPDWYKPDPFTPEIKKAYANASAR